MAASDGSFQRWQAITIGQLTYAIDLFLGFTVAALGFVAALLFDGKLDRVIAQHGSGLAIAILALLLLLVSAASGIFLVVNRLLDFRTTERIARKRETGNTNAIPNDRQAAKTFSDRTWCWFWVQLASFATGVVLLLVAGATISLLRVFAPQPISTYASVSLGMNMSQVEYAIGVADYVSDPFGRSIAETGAARADTTNLNEWDVRKYLRWEYGKPFGERPEITVEFDPKSLRVTKVDCEIEVTHKAGHCPPLMGVQDGMSLDQVISKLGAPTTQTGWSGAYTLTYVAQGIFVLIIKNEVVGYGIDTDAQ